MNPADPVKDGSSAEEPLARQIARRLISSRRSQRKGADRGRAAAAANEDLYGELSRWVGRDGSHALFMRALAQARIDHPQLEKIQLQPRSEPYIDGVAETIMAHGNPATADGLESTLVHVVELLGRLIGDDMATKLIDRSIAARDRGDSTSDDRREEA